MSDYVRNKAVFYPVSRCLANDVLNLIIKSPFEIEVMDDGNNINAFVKDDIYLAIDHTEDLLPFVEFVTSDDAVLERFILSNNSFIASGGDEEHGYYMKRTGFEYDYENFAQFKRRANTAAKKLGVDIFFKGN